MSERQYLPTNVGGVTISTVTAASLVPAGAAISLAAKANRRQVIVGINPDSVVGELKVDVLMGGVAFSLGHHGLVNGVFMLPITNLSVTLEDCDEAIAVSIPAASATGARVYVIETN